jgi:hypothetical protein
MKMLMLRKILFPVAYSKTKGVRVRVILGLAAVPFFLSLQQAPAPFHLWSVTEVYSSPDGSVQYVKMASSAGGQNFLADGGLQLTCTGPQGANTFTIPSDLNPAISTANRNFIIGTSNLATIPGGVTPDYVLTNQQPFLFLTGTNTVQLVGTVTTPLTYTNLPTDGVSALAGTGESLAVVRNDPINFDDETNSIVPVEFSSSTAIGADFVMTFPTATGVNGSAGPVYSVQYNTNVTGTGWSPLTSVTGDGTTKSVSNALSTASIRFFRLSAP